MPRIHAGRIAARIAAPLALVAALVCAAAIAPPATAGRADLPGVASGHRPGPDALYEGAPRAPQLANRGPWRARPILVSGAQAYRNGEWLYQDFLYDDAGAAGVPDINSPWGLADFTFSPRAGTYTYPTDQVYAHNAADLVELRVKPRRRATAFRVTLNTLLAPERTAFTIALGEAAEPQRWPHGAGVSSPAELFLTAHGDRAELLEAGGEGTLRPAPRIAVSRRRRQVEVRVPHAAWDPGRQTVPMTIGVGLWDPEDGRYLAPRLGEASSTEPGGAAPGSPAIVNVGPRFEEPFPDVTQAGLGLTIVDAAAGATVQAHWWRERQQADALAAGDVSRFATEVDFGKLARAERDNSAVPKRGPLNRILASNHSSGQGFDPGSLCAGIGGTDGESACIGAFVGRLQPYSVYVPKGERPRRGWGLTLLLHSLSANYNQYSDSNHQAQLGERAGGSVVVTPAARGPDGFYAGIAEADAFEVWADAARHYRLDPGFAAVTGYSMGGFGTYRLLARWPDLFARGMSIVGIPGGASDQLGSLRNTPIMAWNAVADELVNVALAEQAARDLEAAGVDLTYDLFLAADHLTLATNDEYGPAVEFLGSHRVRRNPSEVSYVVDPSEDSAEAGAIADHAWWVSRLRTRGPGTGTIEARSLGFGRGQRAVGTTESSAGALAGGTHGPMPFARRARAVEAGDPVPREDRIVLEAENLARVAIDVRRARVSCDVRLEVSTDGPLRIVLPGCGRRERFG